MDNAITCQDCSKIYKNLKTYSQHINYNRCNKVLIPRKIDNKCKFCEKVFKTKQNKQRHEVKCNADCKNSLVDENEKLKAIIKKMSTGKLCDNVVVNNNSITNNNNIVINNFGSEDISHITDKHYLQLIGLCKGSIPKLIEDTHFNVSVPENINVYKSNFKDKLVKVLVNNRWNIEDENVVLRELYMKKGEILEEKFEELKYLLSETLKTRFQWFLDNREEEEMMNEIIGYIKKLLYNKRDMIYRTY